MNIGLKNVQYLVIFYEFQPKTTEYFYYQTYNKHHQWLLSPCMNKLSVCLSISNKHYVDLKQHNVLVEGYVNMKTICMWKCKQDSVCTCGCRIEIFLLFLTIYCLIAYLNGNEFFIISDSSFIYLFTVEWIDIIYRVI